MGGTDGGVSKRAHVVGKSLIFHNGILRNEGASALSFQGFKSGVYLFCIRGVSGGQRPICVKLFGFR